MKEINQFIIRDELNVDGYDEDDLCIFEDDEEKSNYLIFPSRESIYFFLDKGLLFSGKIVDRRFSKYLRQLSSCDIMSDIYRYKKYINS